MERKNNDVVWRLNINFKTIVRLCESCAWSCETRAGEERRSTTVPRYKVLPKKTVNPSDCQRITTRTKHKTNSLKIYIYSLIYNVVYLRNINYLNYYYIYYITTLYIIYICSSSMQASID